MPRTQKTTAFSPRKWRLIKNRLEWISANIINYHERSLVLSRQEVLDLLIPEEHQQVIKNCMNVVGEAAKVRQAGSHIRLMCPAYQSLERVPIWFSFGNPFSYIIPDYVGHGFQANAPQDLVDKVMAWANMRVKLASDVALVETVLEHLNELCTLPTQVRLFMPGILALMANIKELQDDRQKLENAEVPRVFPRISNEVRDACQEATKVLARMTLYNTERTTSQPDVETGLNISRLRWRSSFGEIVALR